MAERLKLPNVWHDPPNFPSLGRIPTSSHRFLPVHKRIIIHGCIHIHIIYIINVVYTNTPEATCGQVALFVLCFSPVGSHIHVYVLQQSMIPSLPHTRIYLQSSRLIVWSTFYMILFWYVLYIYILKIHEL